MGPLEEHALSPCEMEEELSPLQKAERSSLIQKLGNLEVDQCFT